MRAGDERLPEFDKIMEKETERGWRSHVRFQIAMLSSPKEYPLEGTTGYDADRWPVSRREEYEHNQFLRLPAAGIPQAM